MEDNKIPKLGLTPAFPSEYSGSEKDEFGTPVIVHRMSYGMSKRLYIATQMMQGLIVVNPQALSNYKLIIKCAYEVTDELLRQENL